MAAADDLFPVKNNFWLGNFQVAINEGTRVAAGSERLRTERDVFVYRAYIGLRNFSVVLDEIRDAPATPAPLRAVRLYALYLSDARVREDAVAAVERMLADPATAEDRTTQLMAASILDHEGRFGDALRAVKDKHGLEQMAMNAQLLVKMDRFDLADGVVAEMQKVDEEATLTQLATAWTGLAAGGAHVERSALLFRDLIDKFGATLQLLNGQGAAFLALGRFEDAERVLLEAASKGPNDPDTLINLIACAVHLGRPAEHVARLDAQLARAAPDHPFVKQREVLKGVFARVAGALA